MGGRGDTKLVPVLAVLQLLVPARHSEHTQMPTRHHTGWLETHSCVLYNALSIVRVVLQGQVRMPCCGNASSVACHATKEEPSCGAWQAGPSWCCWPALGSAACMHDAVWVVREADAMMSIIIIPPSADPLGKWVGGAFMALGSLAGT